MHTLESNTGTSTCTNFDKWETTRAKEKLTEAFNLPSSPEQSSASEHTWDNPEAALERLLLSPLPWTLLFLEKHAQTAEVISGSVLNSQVDSALQFLLKYAAKLKLNGERHSS